MPTPPVKVFISYSHDSPQHAERVLALADRLCADGIDCALDQYETAPPQGWPRWMEQQLDRADFVLVVATDGYLRRAGGGERPAVGRGVRFESVLMVQELYDAGMWNERFVPVLFEGATEADIVRPLRGYTHYRVDTDEGYEALYRQLTGQPLVRKPELGEVKTLPVGKSARTSKDSRKPFRMRWQGWATFAGVALAVLLFLASGISDPPALQVVAGEIRDADTLDPLPGVEVMLTEYGARTTTDATGRYRFEVSASVYTRVRLRAKLEGYQPIERAPLVGGNDTLEMRRVE